MRLHTSYNQYTLRARLHQFSKFQDCEDLDDLQVLDALEILQGHILEGTSYNHVDQCLLRYDTLSSQL